MQRRDFLQAASMAAMSASLTPATEGQKPALLELRTYYLRNNAENQSKRTTDYLQQTWLPAVQRAGVGPVGVFNSFVAPNSPFLMTIAAFPTAGAMDEMLQKLDRDEAYQKGLAAYNATPVNFVRMESSLLRGFETMPTLATPTIAAGKPARLFELRTYESNNFTTLARKVRMFNEGEIALFRKLDMQPIFFGETIIGAKQPNLTYMLAYDDLAMRDRVWQAFGSSPEWNKLKSQPGVSDAEIVSNISNFFVKPLAFSPVR